MSQPGFSGPGVGNFSPGGPSPGPGGLRGGRPPINPSLVDWEDPSEPGPVGSNPAGPAAWSPPQPESGGQGGNFPEAAAAAPILGGGDWRNPPVSGAGPAPTADQPSPSQPAPPDAAEPEVPESATAPRAQVKLAKRFGRETTASNLTVCRTFDLEGSGGDLLPSRLLQALAKQSKLVLAIHFMRAGIDIPEDLPGGVPIRTDLPPEVAGLAGPMLLKPDDFPGFAEVVDQAWDQDAVIAFLTKDPEAAIRHLQQMIHFDEKLEPASKEKKALFCAVYSPNLFTSFLCTRDEAAVKRLLGESIEGVVTEIADLPGNWQLLAQSDWTERLEKLGLKQQETSDVAGP